MIYLDSTEKMLFELIVLGIQYKYANIVSYLGPMLFFLLFCKDFCLGCFSSLTNRYAGSNLIPIKGGSVTSCMIITYSPVNDNKGNI